ncbi:DNA-3-methyladenine glycosylase 2 family protein [Gordonia sp. SID5947]|uniref:DNA-3-methyladenine glycosylase family protein n=1 Tax=Gordonia sp. SID5947 TaxID=2690315 RepID=UPI00136EFD1F|nr:DNA-3-methyladenine glycosylase 2 family protein [Gordonia sp. SID5947]MYR07795.1 DNA-3-methyladenine glycosylase 2 family protein [Gordonia sp. SID5947]
MATHTVRREVLGPWSLEISREFWEGFAPAALSGQTRDGTLTTVFRVDADWSSARSSVVQRDQVAELSVTGDGDLDAAADQVARFLALDIDARSWPDIGERDPVIGRAQQQLPGLRPCGFHSAYEAAAWSVLSQRVRVVEAARMRTNIIDRYGDDGAFPAPDRLTGLDIDLPGRKTEYLAAVAEAALDGRLDTAALRAMAPDDAMQSVQEIKGIGPFAAGLIVLRGANAPDALPPNERRLESEVATQYGDDRSLPDVAELWRPFRTWAAVYLRALRERRGD